MKISDLDYLNTLSEAPSVVGGIRYNSPSVEETLLQLQALGYEIDINSSNTVTDSGTEVNSISATGYSSDGGAFAFASSSVTNTYSTI